MATVFGGVGIVVVSLCCCCCSSRAVVVDEASSWKGKIGFSAGPRSQVMLKWRTFLVKNIIFLFLIVFWHFFNFYIILILIFKIKFFPQKFIIPIKISNYFLLTNYSAPPVVGAAPRRTTTGQGWSASSGVCTGPRAGMATGDGLPRHSQSQPHIPSYMP